MTSCDTPFSFVFTLFGALSNCIDTGISKMSMVYSFVPVLWQTWRNHETWRKLNKLNFNLTFPFFDMLGSSLPCPHPPGQVSPGRELDMDGCQGFSAQFEHFHVL